MSSDARRADDLEAELQRLMHEVDKYRTAAEDALQQLDWCIGYFTGCNKSVIAKSLAANRAYIRRHLMQRHEADVPTPNP